MPFRSNRGNRSAGRGSGRQLRPMDWVCAQMDVPIVNAVSCAWLIDPIDVLETFTDPTLMATRIFMALRTGVTQVGTGAYAGIGIIAWDGTSAAAPTECPGPLSDCDFDWINRIIGIVPETTPAGTFLNPNAFDNTHLSKARRRLPSQTGLLVSFEGEGLTGTVYAGADIRCLIKE